MKNILRPYQVDALEKIRNEIRSGKKSIILGLPTGGGKTSIAAEMFRSARDKGKRAIFICDRLTLIEQCSVRFDAEGIDHGIIQADNPRSDYSKPIQIASIQTLARRAKNKILDFDLFVIDEAHTLFEAHKEIMRLNNNVPVVGLTATWFTKGLGKHFESLVLGATASELIELGFLVPSLVYGPSKPDLSNVSVVAGDYKEDELAEATNKPKLVGDIVEHWSKLAAGRQTLCFAVNIAHSLAIVKAFNDAGIKARHLDCYANDDERKSAIDSLKDGRVQILCSVDLLAKGFDYPACSCAILARPTKSLMVHIQQVGRVLRIADGKDDAIILDHAGNTERHGFVTDELPDTLDDGKPKKKSEPKKRDEKLPTPCASCHFLKVVHKCPQCGFAPEKQPQQLETEAGELQLIKGKAKAKTEYTTLEKAKLFGELKYIAKERNWSDGRLANVFRELTGVWPNKYHDEIPRPPESKTLALIKYLDIRYFKSKQKWVANV